MQKPMDRYDYEALDSAYESVKSVIKHGGLEPTRLLYANAAYAALELALMNAVPVPAELVLKSSIKEFKAEHTWNGPNGGDAA